MGHPSRRPPMLFCFSQFNGSTPLATLLSSVAAAAAAAAAVVMAAAAAAVATCPPPCGVAWHSIASQRHFFFIGVVMIELFDSIEGGWWGGVGVERGGIPGGGSHGILLKHRMESISEWLENFVGRVPQDFIGFIGRGEISRELPRILKNRRDSYDNPWGSYKYPWESLRIPENPEESQGIPKSPKASLRSYENPGESLTFPEDPEKS